MKRDNDYLFKEKMSMNGTIYKDFIKYVSKNSIYKSIQIVRVENKTAFYECEPYDNAYKTGDEYIFETCLKIKRAFKKFHKNIFKKYDVTNISVDIYDEMSCVAGLSVLDSGEIITSNF